MYTVTVEVVFDAAHRLLCKDSKCYHNHGHTYHAWVEVSGESLDDEGMLLDFGIIKGFVRSWINTHWDHAYLCHEQDPLRDVMEAHQLRCYSFSQNPTAETMARELYLKAQLFLADTDQAPVQLLSVKIQETPTSWASYRE